MGVAMERSPNRTVFGRVRSRSRVSLVAIVVAVAMSVTSVSYAGADAVISGVVTAEAGGAPLEGIRVIAMDFHRHQRVQAMQSRADGSYRLTVPAGDYFVVFDTGVDPPDDEYAQEVCDQMATFLRLLLERIFSEL